MKNAKTKFSIFFGLLLFLSSCVDDYQAFTTFTGDLVYSFLEKDTTYSEYVKIIDNAGFKGVLSAYGAYTCFAPNNNAFRNYYKSLGPDFSFKNLSKSQIDTLARMHIVQNKYLISDFEIGVLPNSNMLNRYIDVKIDPADFLMVLNDSSHLISKDNVVYNGVVIGIDHILKASNIQLPDFIKSTSNISIFSAALELTGLSDSLRKLKDANYRKLDVYNDDYQGRLIMQPNERKFGYTALIESDELLKTYDIYNLDDLIEKAKELYPSDNQFDNDFTNRNNSLNKYVAYHLVNKMIPYNKFFYNANAIANYTPDEFIETMYPYRIIRASRINQQVVLNQNTNHTVTVLETANNTTINGVFHLIDKMLVYSDDVESMFANVRLRFDVASLFPELTNNNMRCSRNVAQERNATGDAYNITNEYVDNLKTTNETRFMYQAGKDNQWGEFQSDDFEIIGSYDFTIRLLPVPPGTYELRYGFTPYYDRSTTQIYFDNRPIGIPIDLTILSSHPKIGWVADAMTEDDGYENDKMMRNRGYMKGANTILYRDAPVRDSDSKIRIILGTFTFSEYEQHTLRFKNVLQDNNRNCTLDYFEFVPKSVFNPSSGEPESRD